MQQYNIYYTVDKVNIQRFHVLVEIEINLQVGICKIVTKTQVIQKTTKHTRHVNTPRSPPCERTKWHVTLEAKVNHSMFNILQTCSKIVLVLIWWFCSKFLIGYHAEKLKLWKCLSRNRSNDPEDQDRQIPILIVHEKLPICLSYASLIILG